MKSLALLCTFLLLAAAPTLAGFNVNVSFGDTKVADSSGEDAGGGPPPWAPAHGRRAKHSYAYYPDAECYHDAQRGSWFYFDGGNWKVGVELPDSFKVRLGGSVRLEMDADKPYVHHTAVKTKHPGKGHSKSSKSNGNGKHKGKKKK